MASQAAETAVLTVSVKAESSLCPLGSSTSIALSGVVEAGCKTVIGARCKQSGMFWGEAGAENILALRCIQSSRRLNEFSQARLNTYAACNDALPLAA
jgi:hypothetical protein